MPLTYKEKSTLFIIALFTAISILLAFSSATSGALEVHFFDIGQGDAIFIRTPHGNTMLIDGGPDAKIVERLGKVATIWERRIDLVVATHMDADHIGGLLDVFKRFDVGGVVVSSSASGTKLADTFWSVILEKQIPVFIAERGDLFHLDSEVELLTISPTPQLRGIGSDNNQSLVFKLTYKNDSFLLTGDAERPAELIMLADGVNIDSDVLKIGHHGSNSSTVQGFIDKVTPATAVIQVGENRYGHPHQAVLSRLDGITLLRNDLNGGIVLYSYGDSF